MDDKTRGRIFISYRRSDAPGVAGRLSDTLGTYFGPDRVFRDIEDIAGGEDFASAISGTMSAADAVVVVIGPEWATVTDGNGLRRLDDPADWVATEVGSALERNVPVYPVLVEDTLMPRAEELPERLRPLAHRNAISISDARWASDTTRLAKIIALDVPGSMAERRLHRLQTAMLLVMAAAVVYTTVALTLGASDVVGDRLLLSPAEVTVNYVAVMTTVLLLVLAAPLVDPGRRRWCYAGAALGTFGSLVATVLSLLGFAQSTAPITTLILFSLSTVLVVGILSFMNLSGFKAK